MFYILVFEWMSKALKSIFCIPDTYSIIEVTFIIQAMNQLATSSYFISELEMTLDLFKKAFNWNFLFVQSLNIESFHFCRWSQYALITPLQAIMKFTWFD